jgi:hypothetical protein
MKKETGNPSSPIWLLGDSNPKKWQDKLNTPLDPRHPAMHNIWTPIIDIIQRELYVKIGKRINVKPIYIQNAIEDPSIKPQPNEKNWNTKIKNRINDFRKQVQKHNPAFVFSFGAFSFEFARRCLKTDILRSHNYWGSLRLGKKFRARISDFDAGKVNLIPLLHVSIARGHFLKSHKNFCDGDSEENYFEYVGVRLAEKITQFERSLNVGLETTSLSRSSLVY